MENEFECTLPLWYGEYRRRHLLVIIFNNATLLRSVNNKCSMYAMTYYAGFFLIHEIPLPGSSQRHVASYLKIVVHENENKKHIAQK